jgi:hemimethylated DNA binding protein
MPPSGSPRFLKTLYKGLLGAASKLDAVAPGSLPVSLMPSLKSSPFLPAGHATLAAVVRASFPRACAPGDDARIACAFSLLREANTRAAALRRAPAGAAAALVAGKPRGVFFSVGQCVRHAQHGYVGVVVGWTAVCEASAAWCERNGAEPRQPFYTLLVDVRDRPEAQVTYVAQGALQLLSGGGGGPACLVLHPLLSQHFEAFDAAAGAFVPLGGVAAAFPCDDARWAPAGAARGAAVVRAAVGAGAGERAEGGDEPEPEAEPEAVPVAL